MNDITNRILDEVDNEISNEMTQKKKSKKWKALLILLVCFVLVFYYLISDLQYRQAVDFVNQGSIIEAHKLVCNNYIHPKSRKLVKELEANDPYLPIKSLDKGDTFYFGEYEQDNKNDGKEPIEWMVLENNDGSILALSKYILDSKPFNGQNSNNCTLTSWLENEFYQTAFASVPTDVVSRVSLCPENKVPEFSLMLEEKYGETLDTLFEGEQTAYALAKEEVRCWWCMPSDGLKEGYAGYMAKVVWKNISDRGDTGMQFVNDIYGVRPALWLFTPDEMLPEEPVFNGKIFKKSSGSSSSSGSSTSASVCNSCNGTGRNTKSFGVTWVQKHPEYKYGEPCVSCGGTGKKS